MDIDNNQKKSLTMYDLLKEALRVPMHRDEDTLEDATPIAFEAFFVD